MPEVFKTLFKTLLKTLAFLFLVGVLIEIFVLFYQMNTSISIEEPTVIVFKKGSTIRTLANILHDKDMLWYKKSLLVWAKLNNQTTRLQAGEYIIEQGMSVNDLLDNMVKGKSKQYALTIIEGWTFKQMLTAIRSNNDLKHTIKNFRPRSIMNDLGFAGEHPEGRFFPDTFYFTRGTSDNEVLRRSYDHMNALLKKEWESREQNLPFKNRYEALILASIVEKESAVAEERPVIAGVFINRLRKKMRLQTDPTVIYGMGDAYKGDIRFRDLRRDTPYNTYTRSGLPPTPIALPGQGAIKAVMHPAQTDFLYFVAHSDSSGRHIFTKTLVEHEKQVDLHQRKKRKKKKVNNS